jgi:hypothetical protein
MRLSRRSKRTRLLPPCVPRIPISSGVPASVVTMTKSLPSSARGISKYKRLPTLCTLKTPLLVTARDVTTVA